MTNPVQPQACEILSVKKESRHEWTFRVATAAICAPVTSLLAQKTIRNQFTNKHNN